MKTRICFLAVTVLTCMLGFGAKEARAQCYGLDLHNTTHPASGGMAGVSLAKPQDVPSAIFGNPSTLAQFRGAQFTFGASWTEPDLFVSHDGSYTGIPFSGKSTGQGCVLPSIGVTQDLRSVGIPGTLGLGVASLNGISAQFAKQPGSLGMHSEILAYGINAGAGIDLTDRLAGGAMLTVGYGNADTGFAHNSNMVHDFGLRGTFGLDYDLGRDTTVGVYYQTKLPMRYNDILVISAYGAVPHTFTTLDVEQPDNIGLGFADSSLMGGRLLLAADILYKQWDNAAYWKDLCNNQWAFAFGTQLTRGKWRYRLGYSFAEPPVDPTPGSTVAGLPVGQAGVEFYQATQAGIVYKHRLSAGIGLVDVLPGVTLDLYAGGLLPESYQFGTSTSSSLKLWYAGGGLTWRFGHK